MATPHIPPRRFGPHQTTIVSLIAAAAIVFGLTAALHARVGQSATGEATALPVAATQFRLEHGYQQELSFLGLVQANRRADLGFEIPGRLAGMLVREGSTVEVGDAIARLDDATLLSRKQALQAAVLQASTEMELAEIKAERQDDLRKTGAVSSEAWDETRLRAIALSAQVDAAQAQLDSIDIELSKSVVRAPYAGVIANRYLDVGAVVTPGTPVVRLIESGARVAHIGVSIERAAELVVGTAYPLTLRDQPLEAPLLAIRTDVDPATRTLTAVFQLPATTAALDGEAITLSLSSEVAMSGGWLPMTALLEGQRGIWTVLAIEEQSGELHTVREAVEVLDVQGDRAYVRGSLPDGQRVIASGMHRVAPGSPVTVEEH